MKKLLVSLSTFALVVGALALPASAMPVSTSNVETKNVQAYAEHTLPSGWIDHNIAVWDHSGSDSIKFVGNHKHGLTVHVQGSTQGLRIKVLHAGKPNPIERKFSSSGKESFTVEGDRAIIYFYNDTSNEKRIKVKYTN
ncbi:hypothetical protein ABE137_11720 [Brevibacillus laterosporus]|uniref:hypothetical protein n=1 Tax=Brevibacillus laterosporus TaxID=1465 RepID=UPI003D192F42